MTRAFYTLTPAQQSAFRAAILTVRDERDDGQVEQAFRDLDILRPDVERTHTHSLHAMAADRLALLGAGERAPIEAALFGAPLP